jgi:adenylate cyclase
MEGRMGFEVERKFLVCGDGWQDLATHRRQIRQAYLAPNGRASVRVRIVDHRSATLTIKNRGAGMRRLELEYAIPVLEAESLVNLRSGGGVEKVRHIVPFRGATWEVDVFAGDNAGLLIAEVELREERQHVEVPPWVGAEVTAQAQYCNGTLAHYPFATWTGLPQARTRT